MFYDLPSDMVVPPDDLQRTKFLGKGAFGAVYVGLIHIKVSIFNEFNVFWATFWSFKLESTNLEQFF